MSNALVSACIEKPFLFGLPPKGRGVIQFPSLRQAALCDTGATRQLARHSFQTAPDEKRASQRQRLSRSSVRSQP